MSMFPNLSTRGTSLVQNYHHLNFPSRPLLHFNLVVHQSKSNLLRVLPTDNDKSSSVLPHEQKPCTTWEAECDLFIGTSI